MGANDYADHHLCRIQRGRHCNDAVAADQAGAISALVGAALEMAGAHLYCSTQNYSGSFRNILLRGMGMILPYWQTIGVVCLFWFTAWGLAVLALRDEL